MDFDELCDSIRAIVRNCMKEPWSTRTDTNRTFDDICNSGTEAIIKIHENKIKELRTCVAEANKIIEAKHDYCSSLCCDIANLQDRLSTLEKNLADVHLTCRMEHDRSEMLQGKLSTLMKASEGIEKALEAIAGRYVSIPDYDWCDWNGLDATHETSKIIAEFAKQALADFRAVKEGK